MSQEQPLARLVVLVSGSGTNLQAIIDACEAGRLPARVVAVIANRKRAYALERGRKHGIPTHVHLLKPYLNAGRTRRDYDADLADLVARYEPDLIVLAGWMHILSMAFLSRFPDKVINLHPALPGQFPGMHAIERAFEAYRRGEITHTGVMVHWVPDEQVDAGPVIATATVPIYPEDTLETLTERVHQVEHRLLVETIGRILTERGFQPESSSIAVYDETSDS